jgi:hypothetical protein
MRRVVDDSQQLLAKRRAARMPEPLKDECEKYVAWRIQEQCQAGLSKWAKDRFRLYSIFILVGGAIGLSGIAVTIAQKAADTWIQTYGFASVANALSTNERFKKDFDHILLPIGSIIPFAGKDKEVPTGWLPCDGRALNREQYKTLYDKIGILWGSGRDGTGADPKITAFNLPDLRGVFLRGLSDGQDQDWLKDPDAQSRRNRDNTATAAGVGSYQQDGFRKHIHPFEQQLPKSNDKLWRPLSLDIHGTSKSEHGPEWIASMVQVHAWEDVNIRVGEFGDNETRPKNAAVLFIIKAE